MMQRPQPWVTESSQRSVTGCNGSTASTSTSAGPWWWCSRPTRSPPPGGDEEDGSVDAWIGVKMTARPAGAVEHLHLKRTGFFRWERLEDSGRRVERTGRYHLEESTLSLDYRQITETPTDTGDPDIEVEQGRRSSHPIVGKRGALMVDEVRFERGR